MAKPHMCSPKLLNTDLSGRRIVVTGANGGIGLVCAKQLAKQGAEVIMACRRVEEGEKQATTIRADHPGAKLEVRRLDLGDLSSIRDFANALLANNDTLHALLNNAGVMNPPQSKTVDGFETQFGVNHLGHFLLTDLLLDALKKGAPSRIVCVSSCFHDIAMKREGKIHFEDFHFETRKYDGWEAYAQSKLANLLHAKGLAKRLANTGVTAVSVHPGWVRTDLMKHSMPRWLQDIVLRPVLKMMGMIEPWQGAQTSLHALLADDVNTHSGEFYSQLGQYREKSCNKGGWPMVSPNPVANDPAAADRLWEESRNMVGLT